MTTLNRSQRGFSFAALLLVIVVIGVVAFAGLKVYEMQNASSVEDVATLQENGVPTADDPSATEQTVMAKDVPDTVKTASELAATEQLLDSVSVETDTSSLDADLASF